MRRGGTRQVSCCALLTRGLHLKGVVDAIKVVEDARDGRNLHDLSLVKVIPKLAEQIIA